MKIVVITQHIFPIQSPRATRSTELVKELGRRGYDVTVYAVLGKYDYSQFENDFGVKVKHIPIKWQCTPYSSDGNSISIIDKIASRLFSKWFEFPYIEFMYRLPQILEKEENIDLLISIGDPHHIHWGCAKAKKHNPKIFPKRWIADCGDPFMKNNTTTQHRKHFEKLERLFCQECDAISVPIESARKAYYQEYRNKIVVIPQGFDFNLESLNKEVHNEILSFAYAGIFYDKIRNPQKFFDYIKTFNIDFRFHIYTMYKQNILKYQKDLQEKLVIHESKPRLELIEELKNMDFLLNVENINSPNQLPSKLIDYAIVGRPILSINPEEIDTQKIDEFFNRKYEKQYVVENMEQYHIKNVVDRFLSV